ncbi:hypothetical protein G7Y89_g3384 [Cudoniella acicularis]|uniref:Wax synthase domain-containing protein n=1 Tax=Cudoniella acicularis TaxID=354080 RepID=A0A8H4RRG7_9HELO|nr:hypothetical protein G7Y89_g3384 [Cudoniella acicularis]
MVLALSFSCTLHPLIYLVIQKSLIIFLLAFTTPGSILRPALFPAVLMGNYYLLPTYTLRIPRLAWIGFVSGEILTGPLDYLEKLLISQWSFGHYGPSAEIGSKTRADRQDKPSREHTARSPNSALDKENSGWATTLASSWKRLKFGTWVAISNRYIGSPYQARNTPPYSTSNPNYVPSRSAYLLRRGTVFLACYLIINVLLLGNQPALNPIIYAETEVPFFPRLSRHEITPEEIFTRVSTTLGFWIGAYFTIQGYYSATGFLSVASGLSSQKDRRPTFGSPQDAYSIRRFWGVFWHQLMRKKFTTIAEYVTFPLLRLFRLPHKPHTILPRYTQLVLAFVISGLLHQSIEMAQELRWNESGALEFYVLMAMGIIAEDVVVWGWGRVVGDRDDE